MGEVQGIRPAGTHGLQLAIDPAQAADGILTIANGARYPLAGGITARFGRRRFFGVSGGASQPVVGYFPYYDEEFYTAPGAPRNSYILKHLYKSWGYLHLGFVVGGTFGPLLMAFDEDKPCQMVGYQGRVFIASPGTAPKVFRRKPESQQTVGAEVLYQVVDWGIRFPTTNDKPTCVVAAGGQLNPAGAPFPGRAQYRFRITGSDSSDDVNPIVSNPSLPSAAAAIEVNQTNMKITIDWSLLNATFPASVTKVQLWMQVTMGGVTSSYLQVPEAAGTGKFTRSDGAYNSTFVLMGTVGSETWPALEISHGFDHGHPPKIRSAAIVNDVVFAIASPDTVYRERQDVGQFTRVPSRFVPEHTRYGIGADGSRIVVVVPEHIEGVIGARFAAEGSTIKAIRVDSSCLFIGKVLAPEYMEDWQVVGDGSEIGTAVTGIGKYAIIFTDRSIWSYDTELRTLRPIFSEAGCVAPDSIVRTTDGVYFIGTDAGIYRTDGASVSVVGAPLDPFFKQEDFEGYYPRFDRDRPDAVQSVFSGDRVMFSVPVKVQEESGIKKCLVVGDLSQSPVRWSIDLGFEYEILRYLPTEHAILAIERGQVYAIETGDADQHGSFFPPIPPDTPVFFDITFKKTVGANFRRAIWKRFSVDIDLPLGETLTAVVEIDDNPALAISYTITGAGRHEFGPKPLPARFRGRFATLRLFGNARPTVYGYDIEGEPMGVF